MTKIKVIMCGSDFSVKGGMVSVAKNYVEYENWNAIEIKYIPTHVEKNKFVQIFYFIRALIRIIFASIFGGYKFVYLHTAERGSFYRKAIIVQTMRILGKKTIMHHHAAEFEQFYEGVSERRKKFVDGILERVDLNIVLSKNLVSMITSKSPRANVKVLYNAVNVYDNNPYNPEGNGILFLGRIGKRKGTFDLIEAIKKLDDQIPKSIHFYICGDGEVEKARKLISDYKLDNRIAHLGWIDFDEKKNIFRDCIINILPSYNEGLPMTILETMAYGIPNISTPIASIPEVIHDTENGFLVEPGNVEEIVSVLKSLICDRKLRKKFSEESWSMITKEFSLKTNVQTLEKYIEEMV